MTTPPPILSVRNLSVVIDGEDGSFKAIDDLSFDVERAETVAIVGESGSGKTLSALSIIGLLPTPPARISGGGILFRDRDLTRLGEPEMCEIRGNRISMVFQEPGTALNPVHQVGRQIGEVIRLHRGLGRRTAREQVLALMELVGIADPRRRYRAYPHQLSGGTRQRVMIAMALACRPDLLLADEPTTALDPTVQAQIVDLLARLIRDLRMSVLLITHDLGVVATLADRVVVMHDGRIVEEGGVGRVLEAPTHPYTRTLLEARLSFTGAAAAARRLAGADRFADNGEISGCPFAGSCREAIDDCSARLPELLEVEPGHRVRCFAREVRRG